MTDDASCRHRRAGRRSCSPAPASYDPPATARHRGREAGRRLGGLAGARSDHDAGRRSSGPSATRACAAAAGRGYPTGRQVARRARAVASTSPLRRGQRLRGGSRRAASTGRSWRPTRTPSWRASRSPPSPSAPTTRLPRRQRRATRRRSSGSRQPSAPAEAAGLLGANVLGTGVDAATSRSGRSRAASCSARRPSCCERTGEQARAQPDQRPPYPSERGLWGEPTVGQQRRDARGACRGSSPTGRPSSAAIGDPDEPGHHARADQRALVQRRASSRCPPAPRCASWSKGRRRGRDRRRLKAVLVGGPSGGFLPPDGLDTPSSARRARRGRRHHGLRAPSSSSTAAACIVDLATLLSASSNDESCGKTIPCRIGTRRLARARRSGSAAAAAGPRTRTLLLDLAADIRDGALCGLESRPSTRCCPGCDTSPQEFDGPLPRAAPARPASASPVALPPERPR